MLPAAPRLKIKTQLLLGDEIAMGPGKAELLSWVDRAGSISAAAKGMGLSYRRAWLMVDLMNRCFAAPLVTTAHGGARGGGARLTPEGHTALAAFRRIEAAAQQAADEAGESLRALLAP
jgi:molybdate transport system regulatory protein